MVESHAPRNRVRAGPRAHSRHAGIFFEFLFGLNSPICTGPHYVLVAVSVALALVLVVMWGSLSGRCCPFC